MVELRGLLALGRQLAQGVLPFGGGDGRADDVTFGIG